MNPTFFYRTILTVCIATSLAACDSNNDNSNSTTTGGIASESSSIASQTVENALAEFPNQILPRFALSNSAVAAAEIYRRVEFTGNTVVESWGVEGASDDERQEIEARFSSGFTLLETINSELIDTLPSNIQNDVAQRYPGAGIDEIVQVANGTAVNFEILIEDDQFDEREANYNSETGFLFEELVIERTEVPTNVLATVDALNITLPDSEFERITQPDGEVAYAVEFESDAGQSISISLTEAGVITQVEHEEALSNLSTSDTVDAALIGYPQAIEPDFAAMASEVNAIEIFRNINFSSNSAGEITYGIEGISADETLEIEALYSAEAIFLSDVRGLLVNTLPAAVETAFDARFSNAEIDEIIETTDAQGIRYAIVFISEDSEELEANFDINGDFLSLEDELEEDEIPDLILTAIGNERVLLPIVEFEAVTDNNQIVTYAVEYENEDGDSISYLLNETGQILSIEHEGALPR